MRHPRVVYLAAAVAGVWAQCTPADALPPKEWLAKRTLTNKNNWGLHQTLTQPDRWDPCRGPDRVECPAVSRCVNGKCLCPPGTAGYPACTTADICASAPCLHGGTCLQAADALDPALAQQMAGLYFCSCAAAYEGENCGCRVCGPRGTCRPEDGSCLCERGFIGEFW